MTPYFQTSRPPSGRWPFLEAEERFLPGMSTTAAADSDVIAAQKKAERKLPGSSTTVQDLVEKWRRRLSPEIPLSVLIAFIRYESAGFEDATHGTAKNTPPFSRPAFYELGLFQTPAGDHGKCTSGSFHSCEIPPPGRENPKDPSSWKRLCCDGADCSNCGPIVAGSSHNWTDPNTQARVGLLDLENGARAVRTAFPGLFPRPGSDWDLRVAVLLRFAGGGGYVAALLRRFQGALVALAEQDRWRFLDGKLGSTGYFRNVNEKMSLAAKLGYQP
jgi:hypothetical protein